jgi:hypothetical protein
VLPFLVTLALGATWSVERAPVVPEPWSVTEWWQVSPSTVAVIVAVDPPAPGALQRPSRWGFFLSTPGHAPTQLLAGTEALGATTGAERLLLRTEGEQTRVFRVTAQRTLLDLGTFSSPPQTVACQPRGFPCVALGEGGLTWLESPTERHLIDVDPSLSAPGLSPDGRFVVADRQGALALFDLVKHTAALVMGRVVLRGRSIAEVQARLEAQPKLQEQVARDQDCRADALRWLDAHTVLVGTSDAEAWPDDEGGTSTCTRAPYALDALTLARSPVPKVRLPELDGPETLPANYPWAVVPCSPGGWRRRAGPALLTPCRSELDLMRPMVHTRPGEQVKFLAEALALTDDTLAVFAAREHDAYTWYRGALNGPSAPVFLDGPSVVTLTNSGVTVQPLDWPFTATTHLALDLDDDWHLVTGDGAPPLFVRFHADAPSN